LNKVISPSGQFVAVGNGGVIFTGRLNQVDGSVSWDRRRTGSDDLNGLLFYRKDAALAYSNSYVAFGRSGVTLFSR
jgi:hypothetical protein